MQKTFILMIFSSLLVLCAGAQLFSVNQPNSFASVRDYYYIH